MSINDKYSITWENSVYTITYDVTPVVTVQISSYGLSLFPSYRNPDVFYMGPTDQNLTTLNWTLCTSPANADFPRTMQGLLTAIQNLNTGQATYGSLDLVVSDGTDGHPASSGDLTVGGSVDIDGATTFGGTVTANADATFNYPVTLKDTLSVAGTSTFSETVTVDDNVNITGGNLAVTSTEIPGATPVGGNLSITGTSSLTGDVTTRNTLTVGTNLSVDGTSTLTGDVTTTNALTVGTNLTVDGTSTFTGDASFNGILTSVEAIQIQDTLYCYGDPRFRFGSLGDGTGTMNVYAPDINSTVALYYPPCTATTDTLVSLALSQTFTGDNTFSGTTTISGALDATSTLSVTGTSGLTGDVTTTNTLTVGTDLTVDGTSTLTGAVTCSDTLATPSINVNSGGALTSLYAVSATITTQDGYNTSLNCTIVVVGSMCFFNFPSLSFTASASDALNLNGGFPSGIAPLNATFGYFPGQVGGTWTMMGYEAYNYGGGPNIWLMTTAMNGSLTAGTDYYFPAFVISWAI